MAACLAMTSATVVVAGVFAWAGQPSLRGQAFAAAAGALTLGLAASLFGAHLADASLFSESRFVDALLTAAARQGQPPDVMAGLAARRADFEYTALWLFRLSPALFMFALGLSAAVADRLARVALARTGRETSSRGPFEFWKLPDPLAWSFIAGGGLLLMGLWGQLTPASILGGNLLTLTGAMALVAGLAVVAYYLRRWGIPGPIRALNYVVVVSFPPCAFAAAAVGLFDIWFDFRRLTVKEEEKA